MYFVLFTIIGVVLYYWIFSYNYSVQLVFVIILHVYVLLNARFLLALSITWPVIIFDRVTCNGVIIDHGIDITLQYWLHQQQMAAFIAWISKTRDLSCSDSYHWCSQSSIKIDFKIDFWWFSNKLAVLRENGYN
jgi:hypothetical protein